MSKANGPETTPARREKAMLMLGIPVGGMLTLAEGKLTWKRSLWASFGAILDKGPPSLEVGLDECAAAPGGRRPPWTEVVLSILGWGLLIPVVTLRPSLWLGPLNLILLVLTGSFRQTIKVETSTDAYYFAVKDVQGWLQGLAAHEPRVQIERGRVEQARTPYQDEQRVQGDQRNRPTLEEQWQAFLKEKKSRSQEGKPPP